MKFDFDEDLPFVLQAPVYVVVGLLFIIVWLTCALVFAFLPRKFIRKHELLRTIYNDLLGEFL